MSKKNKHTSLNYILLLKHRISKKSICDEENVIHVSDSKSIESLEKSNVDRIETSFFILDFPRFSRVNVNIVDKGVKPIIFKLTPPVQNQVQIQYTYGMAYRYHIEVSKNIFEKYKVEKSIGFWRRICLPPISFEKVYVNSILAFDKRPRTLQKLVFDYRRININLNPEGILELLMSNTSIAGNLLPEIDIGELLFEEPLENTGLAGSRYVGEPFIILTNEDLWYVVAEISKEIYRECRGGFPKPHIITKREELESLIELGEKLNDRIIVIRKALDVFGRKKESDVSGGNKDDENLLSKIVQEMFSEGLGFLILVARDREEEKKLIEMFSRDYIYKPKIIRAFGEKLNDYNKASILLNLILRMWGLKLPLNGPPRIVLRMLFSSIERKYKDFIDRNLRLNEYLYKVKRHEAEPEKESEDHLALKALTIRYLAEKLNIPLEDIEVEHQLKSGIADIYVDKRGIVVEIETLYETGSVPILKIRDTVLKYKDPSVKEIWVVIRNLPALIHFKNLLKLLKFLRKEMRDKKIKFYVADIEHNTLANMEEIINNTIANLLKEKVR